MELFKEKSDCCGCTACMNICPKSAISMQTDEKGFKYPVIDNNKCIECGACKRVCAFQNGIDNKSRNLENIFVYAAKNSSDNIRKTSASGGAFTPISDYVLENNGLVVGAVFEEGFNVKHTTVTTKEEREKIKGSKYVQSNLGFIFKDVKKNLVNNKLVLFTGTPCQVAALRKYLNKDYENLILCDIICHGVPSPLIFKDYLDSQKKKYKKNIKSVCFRDKQMKWTSQAVSITFEDNSKYIKPHGEDEYRIMFTKDYLLRPSCFECKYPNLNRPSDITIGDFWGIHKVMPDFADDMGVSLILVNTPKGEKIFNSVKDKFVLKESNKTDCLQRNLQQPSKKPEKYNEFWKEYSAKGYRYVAKKYSSQGIKFKIKRVIKKVLGK